MIFLEQNMRFTREDCDFTRDNGDLMTWGFNDIGI